MARHEVSFRELVPGYLKRFDLSEEMITAVTARIDPTILDKSAHDAEMSSFASFLHAKAIQVLSSSDWNASPALAKLRAYLQKDVTISNGLNRELIASFRPFEGAGNIFKTIPIGESLMVPRGSSLTLSCDGLSTTVSNLKHSITIVREMFPDPPCASCGKSAHLHCSRCKSVRYCSKECQTNHWPAHKAPCFRLAQNRPKEGAAFKMELTKANIDWLFSA